MLKFPVCRRSTFLPLLCLAVIVVIFFAHSKSNITSPKTKKHKYDEIKSERQVQAPSDYSDARVKNPSEMEPVLYRPKNG